MTYAAAGVWTVFAEFLNAVFGVPADGHSAVFEVGERGWCKVFACRYLGVEYATVLGGNEDADVLFHVVGCDMIDVNVYAL